MKKIRVGISIQDFPPELHPFLSGADVYDSSSSSSARTLYIDPDYYLKIDERGALRQEALMTDWFHRRGLAPEAVCCLSVDRDYLLTRRAPGEDCLAFLDDPERLCQVLARTLRKLHGLSPAGLPRSTRLERYLASAEDRNGGCWDESVLMPEFMVRSREEAWDIMQTNKHRLRHDVCIHGDFCLPNVILDGGRFSSFIDLPMAGAGDRHIDLYWAVWSLRHNLQTGRYTDRFLDLYGRDNFDQDMLQVIAAFEVFG